MLLIRDAQFVAMEEAVWRQCLDRLRRAAAHACPQLDVLLDGPAGVEAALQGVRTEARVHHIEADEDVATVFAIACAKATISPRELPDLQWTRPILARYRCSGKARLGMIRAVLRDGARQDPAYRRLLALIDAMREAFDAAV